MGKGPNEGSKNPMDVVGIIESYFSGLNEVYKKQILRLLGASSLEELRGITIEQLEQNIKNGKENFKEEFEGELALTIESMRNLFLKCL